MYLGRTLTIIGMVYIAAHVVHGAWTCHTTFCPGDSETDWVYEYETDEGKKFVVVEGRHIPKDSYKESSK